MFRILIVEDNPSMREMLCSILEEKGYITESAGDVSDAMLLLKSKSFSLIISDYQLPDKNGIDFLCEVKDYDIPFIILTAFGSVETAVKAMKNGASDFISKPVDPDYLFLLIEKIIKSEDMKRENQVFKNLFSHSLEQLKIIGKSEQIKAAALQLEKVADADTPVLLLGESGTGKELFARAIHKLSSRKNKPFIALNSASIPDNLLENELFGHERGSFTDAVSTQQGKLEMAQGGTFFLDEIGDLSYKLQSKILRVIEEQKITKLGSTSEIQLDLRFIFATNKDLNTEVRENRFRSDLFFRINVFPITLPPLRERYGDIKLLAEHFTEKFSKDIKKREIKISEHALKKLCSYKWPGNVRELQNSIERAVILCSSGIIEPADIVLVTETEEDCGLPFSLEGTLKEIYERATEIIDKKKIKSTLAENDNNRKKSAELLGISTRTLHDKIKKYDLEKD